jgi:hypothetical protein
LTELQEKLKANEDALARSKEGELALVRQLAQAEFYPGEAAELRTEAAELREERRQRADVLAEFPAVRENARIAEEVSDAAQRTAAELRLEVADAKARAKRAGVELRQESQEVQSLRESRSQFEADESNKVLSAQELEAAAERASGEWRTAEALATKRSRAVSRDLASARRSREELQRRVSNLEERLEKAPVLVEELEAAQVTIKKHEARAARAQSAERAAALQSSLLFFFYCLKKAS